MQLVLYSQDTEYSCRGRSWHSSYLSNNLVCCDVTIRYPNEDNPSERLVCSTAAVALLGWSASQSAVLSVVCWLQASRNTDPQLWVFIAKCVALLNVSRSRKAYYHAIYMFAKFNLLILKVLYCKYTQYLNFNENDANK